MIAEYVNLTGDDTVMAAAFEPVVRYLMLWDMDDTGRLLPRKGNWRWFDHLFNVDDTVLEHALYYSALGFAQRMAAYTGCTAYDDWLEQRREGIRTAFARDFWKGRYFTSGSHADDRANAIAVLAGLVPREAYAKIRMVLRAYAPVRFIWNISSLKRCARWDLSPMPTGGCVRATTIWRSTRIPPYGKIS